MTEAYLTLTEKEKQTLRLLVVGYDAKSMARHLGLSVHTVNERLRDARRKMSVSSSREAARQLRAAESEAPDFLADKQLGDAQVSIAEHGPDITSDHTAKRRWIWAIGGFVMLSFAFAILALSSGPAVVPPAATAAQAASVAVIESDAASAARLWLEQGDASNWDAAYAGTSAAFHSNNTAAHWADVSRQVRVPLGALVSRVLLSDDDVPTPPSGARIVKFRTTFANKSSAIETVAMVREGGAWKVTGIYLD